MISPSTDKSANPKITLHNHESTIHLLSGTLQLHTLHNHHRWSDQGQELIPSQTPHQTQALGRVRKRPCPAPRLWKHPLCVWFQPLIPSLRSRLCNIYWRRTLLSGTLPLDSYTLLRPRCTVGLLMIFSRWRLVSDPLFFLLDSLPTVDVDSASVPKFHRFYSLDFNIKMENNPNPETKMTKTKYFLYTYKSKLQVKPMLRESHWVPFVWLGEWDREIVPFFSRWEDNGRGRPWERLHRCHGYQGRKNQLGRLTGLCNRRRWSHH